MDSAVNRRILLGAAMALPGLALSGRLWAQTLEERRIRQLLGDPAKLAQMLSDPFGLGRYRADNERILAAREKVDIVFMGDSITQGWKDKRPAFFAPGRVGRGISGQTTPQMLVRMMPDVVALKPRAVHIMAGTNDIAGNTGPMTLQMTRDNFRAMTAIARQHGIKVLLASIPPAASFPWRPGLETLAPIAEQNRWLKTFAKESNATWVDYHPVLADAAGAMRAEMAYDGVHPTEAGYDAMAKVANPILKRLLG